MMEIKFNKIIENGFMGRNGGAKASGITAWLGSSQEEVWIEPITSQGKIGNCWIRIPKENIQDFINLLEKLK